MRLHFSNATSLDPTEKQHGGPRRGAGRKRKEKTVVVSLRLPAKRVQSFQRQAKTRSMRLSKYLEAILLKQIVVREHKWPGDPVVIDVEM